MKMRFHWIRVILKSLFPHPGVLVRSDRDTKEEDHVMMQAEVRVINLKIYFVLSILSSINKAIPTFFWLLLIYVFLSLYIQPSCFFESKVAVSESRACSLPDMEKTLVMAPARKCL